MRRKSPGQLNTRCIRVGLVAYSLFKQRTALHDTSMAEEVDKLLGVENPRQLELRVSGVPVLQVTPRPTIAVNGSKAVAFVVKPKGGIIDV